MFRFSKFDYDGIHSGEFNLILPYTSNDYDFVSGGEYQPTTDTLPHNARQLLYNISYADKPLEFTVDIINLNPDEMLINP